MRRLLSLLLSCLTLILVGVSSYGGLTPRAPLINIGDIVFDENAEPVKVVGIAPNGKLMVVGDGTIKKPVKRSGWPFEAKYKEVSGWYGDNRVLDSIDIASSSLKSFNGISIGDVVYDPDGGEPYIVEGISPSGKVAVRGKGIARDYTIKRSGWPFEPKYREVSGWYGDRKFFDVATEDIASSSLKSLNGINVGDVVYDPDANGPYIVEGISPSGKLAVKGRGIARDYTIKRSGWLFERKYKKVSGWYGDRKYLDAATAFRKNDCKLDIERLSD